MSHWTVNVAVDYRQLDTNSWSLLMASELYNTIDALSREKGIDPQIVVSAVEDAIVVATRKYYKTQENLRAELDKDTGKIRAFAVQTVVETPEQVEDPTLQITLEDARKVDPERRSRRRAADSQRTEGILGRIAAQLAKQVIFQKVREAERDTVYNEYIGRVGEIVNATVKRIEGPDVIFDIGKAEAAHAAQRAVASGVFRHGRARSRGHCARRESFKRPGSRGFPRRAGAGAAPVPDRSAGNLRWHGRDSRHRSRSRRAHQDRRHVQRQRRGRGRRLRWHEGHARAVHHPRAARRKD